MTLTLTTQDQRLRESVLRQLEWDPRFDASRIAATAIDGIVTLSGYVDSYVARLAAEESVRSVYGVRGIANELHVALADDRPDAELAQDATLALRQRVDVPAGLDVTVRHALLTLTGVVPWMHQKLAAERAVSSLRGLRGVQNHIAVRPLMSPRDVQHRIVEALHRAAGIDARRLHVDADGRTVTLSGSVRSWSEKDEVERIAWTAAGVAEVRNRIDIVP